jgi:hypothetical protein
MIETKIKHKARRGRIFPEIQWTDEKKAQWKAEHELFYQRCRLIFERLQPELIKTHYNWYLIIEPENEDYLIIKNKEEAIQIARQKYQGNKRSFLFKINETGICGTL